MVSNVSSKFYMCFTKEEEKKVNDVAKKKEETKKIEVSFNA